MGSSDTPVTYNTSSQLSTGTPPSGGVFLKLVRSLSRSKSRSTQPPPPLVSPSLGTGQTDSKLMERRLSRRESRTTPNGSSPGSSGRWLGQVGEAPDSYFPPPPSTTLGDDEASGRGRHPESRGARAADIGSSNQGAPGVSFAPSSPPSGSSQPNHNFNANYTNGAGVPNGQIPGSELDGWAPPPRRTTSMRERDRTNRRMSASATVGTNSVALGKPIEVEGGSGLSRTRKDASGKSTSRQSPFADPAAAPSTSPFALPSSFNNTAGVGSGSSTSPPRRGVQLEDKPLSRRSSTSVKRALTTVKKGVERFGGVNYVPSEKIQGEQRVLILVADGSEEIEVLTPFDVFVRASLNPTIVSVSPMFSPSQSLPYITMSRGAKLLADTQFETLRQEYKDDFDAIIIPGGAKGAERISQDIGVQTLLRSFHKQGKLVGMICAGSLAAKTSGIALGQKITSHPSVRADLEKDYHYSEDRVVISGNLITSRGPGTALEWALTIVEVMAGKKKRDEVEGPMLA